jgi:hypothetical protein
LQEPDHVDLRPVLHQAAVGDTVNGDACHRQALASLA